MKRKILTIIVFLSTFLLQAQSHTNSGSVTINTERGKELHFDKFVERACEAVGKLEHYFKQMMSSKYRHESVKLNKAFANLEKMFEKDAKIEVLNTNNQKRVYLVHNYFTKIREYYLTKYNRYFEISFNIKCDKSSFKRVNGGIVGSLDFTQVFRGENKEVYYEDFTLKNIKFKSYTEIRPSGVKKYGVKFTGIEAKELLNFNFGDPKPFRKN